ncbi:MAG: histidine--tRNA ligase [Deltaproteobacteria bacterium]|nr:histidine--tRNA ligase [Deltaproteobacteria bacterium]
MEFSSLKGFKDILPEEVGAWQRLEMAARGQFEVFGFHEIKPPILEMTELFSRGIGQDTDIVSKEMYSFQDVKGRGMTMRPEATASVVRAYVQHRLYQNYAVQKLYSIGPMFRHERPQKGRFRQFHQINAELFGDAGPKSDADIILMAMGLFESIGLDDLSLQLNSLGCPQCRVPFKETLQTYLKDKIDALCEDCRRRTRTNPLRVFDCKTPSCKAVIADAPSIVDVLCDDCRAHFDAVKGYLELCRVPFNLNHHLVRGLDYYNRTTFEIQTEHLGAQNAVAGGGRYDGLVKRLGGPDHSAIGFAVGMERVVALMEAEGRPEPRSPDLFIAALGEDADRATLPWAEDLRRQGFWVEMDYGSKGLKSQMKKAGRLNAKKVLIVGDEELKSNQGILRDMISKNQRLVGLNQLPETLAREHLT